MHGSVDIEDENVTVDRTSDSVNRVRVMNADGR